MWAALRGGSSRPVDPVGGIQAEDLTRGADSGERSGHVAPRGDSSDKRSDSRPPWGGLGFWGSEWQKEGGGGQGNFSRSIPVTLEAALSQSLPAKEPPRDIQLQEGWGAGAFCCSPSDH